MHLTPFYRFLSFFLSSGISPELGKLKAAAKLGWNRACIIVSCVFSSGTCVLIVLGALCQLGSLLFVLVDFSLTFFLRCFGFGFGSAFAPCHYYAFVGRVDPSVKNWGVILETAEKG